MKVHEFEQSVFYRTSCDCGSNDCDLTIEIEYDKDFPDMLFLYLHKQLNWSAYWNSDSWLNEQLKKLKAIYRIIFWGYVEVEESFVFKGIDHIDNFINAIEDGRSKFSALIKEGS